MMIMMTVMYDDDNALIDRYLMMHCCIALPSLSALATSFSFSTFSSPSWSIDSYNQSINQSINHKIITQQIEYIEQSWTPTSLSYSSSSLSPSFKLLYRHHLTNLQSLATAPRSLILLSSSSPTPSSTDCEEPCSAAASSSPLLSCGRALDHH